MSARLLSPVLSSKRWIAALAICVAMVSWMTVPEGFTQVPMAAPNPAVLDGLIAQIKVQQEQMAENQTKIETQTAALKEELRLVKIYSARGGSSSRR